MKKTESEIIKNKSDQKKIGYFIKTLRQQKGLTQSEFAELLKTSQSAVARIENGGQNLTTAELLKISEILNRKIISISDEWFLYKSEDFNSSMIFVAEVKLPFANCLFNSSRSLVFFAQLKKTIAAKLIKRN